MGYMNRFGKRAQELASKSSHSHIIRDPEVEAFLSNCQLPALADDVSLDEHTLIDFAPVSPNPVRHVIAVDAGYTEVAVRAEFPSATVCFFQFGALFFSIADLEALDDSSFIDPDDIARLKTIQRLKLTLPMKNMGYAGQKSLTHSVRAALHQFFSQSLDGESLSETLKWLVFEEFRSKPRDDFILASSPYGDESEIPLRRAAMRDDYSWERPSGDIYLTDVFRLHERIDDAVGAGGIQAYAMTAIEQLILAHVIRLILKTKPSLLHQVLFIKDGPLAFFGVTARLHEPMRELLTHLAKEHNVYVAGLEKSGTFVEHAHEVKNKLPNGTCLVLDDDYIYRYIIPGQPDPKSPYGRTTYYGNKVVFKTPTGAVHVVSIPTSRPLARPKLGDLKNLDAILTNIEKLRCDMYDDALLPIALVNKLVSLSNHPSSKVLQQFAKGAIGG